MNTIQKIAATTTAVAALAGGTYFAVTTEEPNDGSVYTPTIPVAEVAVAEIYVPKIAKAEVSVLSVPTAQITYVAYDKAYDVYDSTDDYYDSQIQQASINKVNVQAIKVSQANVETYTNAIILNKASITKARVYPADIESTTIDSAKVTSASSFIKASQDFLKSFTTFFKSKPQLFFDSTINRHNQRVADWINVAPEYTDYTQAFVAMPTNIKAVAEVHHPINSEILTYNLDRYSTLGYNAVLLSFGYEGEDIYELKSVAELIHAYNMQVILAYSGPETHKHSILDYPASIDNKLSVLAPVSDGLIVGWRRTSLHMYEHDSVFTNFIIKNARKYNSKLYTLGEAFYGELTTNSLEIKTGLAYNIPTNSSGVLIVGLGRGRIAVERVVSGLLKDTLSYNRVVLISGERPYYDTVNKNGWNNAQNYSYKEGLLKRWNKAGVSNAIVLHGDGSDGRYDSNKTDNIAYTKYEGI